MQTFAVLVILFIGVVVLVQLARGTLGRWLSAKFLGRPGSGGAGPTTAIAATGAPA